VGARSLEDVMKFVPQNPSQSAPEKKIAAGSGSRCERAAKAVAFNVGKWDHGSVRDVSVGQGDGFAGQRRRKGLRGASAMESDNHDAGEGIRGGDLVEASPVQFDTGTSHEVLEFPFHFVDGGLRVLGFELKDERYPRRREGGAG
jgi:hypothetical protein